MSLPTFPEFKPLEISDQAEVEAYFEKFPSETSDYTFPNLFIWRNYDHPKLSLLNNNLIILLSPAESTPYFLFPIGKTKIEETLDACLPLRMVPEKLVKKYFEYQAKLDRNNSDYVYRTSDLINLKGRKYDGKRNWIKRFLSQYLAEYVNLTPELLPDCFELLEKWGKTRQGFLLKYELQAIVEALNNIETLNLIARVILISRKVEAFMVGGKLNPETAIVYIQVANREILGLPQFFHQKFTAEELASFKYVNWEQDLGTAGLRKAKLSYQPCRLIHKYNVSK